MKLKNNSRIAVIGGGPAGSFFCYFIIEIAKRLNINLNIDLYDPKRFNQKGPSGCNHCGGIISESLVQVLASEGINIPSEIIQVGIDSYIMHMDIGSAKIDTPVNEKRIASIFRASGPSCSKGLELKSFDQYLQDLIVTLGVNVIHEKVISVAYNDEFPVVNSNNNSFSSYDLVVGAVGVNTTGFKMFEKVGIGYKSPELTKTFICEYNLGKSIVQEFFGSSMHVFLLNISRIKFAALIPKGDFVTMVVLGSEIDMVLVNEFLESVEVKECFPPGFNTKANYSCKCFPKINTGIAKTPYDNRIVLIGDSAVSRLYKDGIGAAYYTSKAAATTAMFHGVSKLDFKKNYWPVCKDIRNDNKIGKIIFSTTRLIQFSKLLRKILFFKVIREQRDAASKLLLSSILWDTFTGSASYLDIFKRAVSPVLFISFIKSFIMGLFNIRSKNKPFTISKSLSDFGLAFQNGETIVNQGEVGNCMYVIQEGEVEIVKSEKDKEIRLSLLKSGDFFGEMALFEEEVRSATAKAIGEVRLITVDKKTLLSRIQKDPSLTFRILQNMSSRIRNNSK